MDNVEDIYPLTPTQAGILYHTLRDPDTSLYFEQVRTDITGPLDPDLLRAAWKTVVRRHPAMRTIFLWEGLDDPLQVVRGEFDLPWSEVDLSNLDGSDQGAELDAICEVERSRGISLTKAPVSRFVLIRLGEVRWHLVWNFHHILLDGWSAVAVANEALTTYRGEPTRTHVRPFRDHVAWLQTQDHAAAESYWQTTLSGFEAATPLRLGTGSGAHEFDLGQFTHRVAPGLSDRLRQLARTSRVTLNTLVQAAWGVVLSRYSGETDVVFGVTLSGRPAQLDGVEDIVGMFLNTLPMRLEPPFDVPVSEWLVDVQRQQLDISSHQYSSLADVQRWSEVAPGEPLFDSVLIFENYPMASPTATDEVRFEHRSVFEQSHYGLTVMVRPDEDLAFVVLYDRSRFGSDVVLSLFTHMEQVMLDMVDRPGVAPGRLEILSATERAVILDEWNDSAVYLGSDTTIGEMFAEQVALRPDATALIFGDEAMSFDELDRRSSQVAHLLLANGVGRETTVGIAMYRSFEMMIGLLATVKAGGAYVPLDPAYPAARIELIAGDAGLDVILTHAAALGRVPDCNAKVIDLSNVDLDEVSTSAPQVDVSPDDSVFVTFTSGSTGRPKGVQGHHRGIINRIRWQWRQFPLDDDEICCQKTTLNFVDHIWEIWGPLLAGTPQVLVSEDVVLDTPRFLDLLASHQVRRIVLVPSYIHALLDAHPDLAERLPDLKFWTFSGEGVSRALADRFRFEMPHATLLNFYGMSEVTLDATFYDDRWATDCETVPIGRPISNHRVYVLDAHERLAPTGVIGEIHVSGVGLSRGYWGRDDLTAERFKPHPFIQNERLYSTGDIGRWLPSGDLEYIGRSDSQVKIRGSRVELAEVEAAIAGAPGVNDCIVTAQEHLADTRLISYVTPDDPDGDAGVLAARVKDYTTEVLPSFMVPAAIVVLEEFPRTPNGKVDRRDLPAPLVVASVGSTNDAEATESEREMLALWTDLLETSVGLDDDFFDAGGHSLLALRLAARVSREFGRELPLSVFFDASTPRQLAAYVMDEPPEPTWTHLVPISSGRDGRPNIFCVHGAGGNVMSFRSLGGHLAGEWSVVGIQASGVDGVSGVHSTMDDFCDAYIAEVLSYQPKGPYVLAGYSAGGVIAYEMARRLAADGREVAAVVLLDTYHPGVKPSKLPTPGRAMSLLRSGPSVVADRFREVRWSKALTVQADKAARVDTATGAVPADLRQGHLTLGTTAAIGAYTPARYDGYVLLFGAERINWAYERTGHLRGWADVATNIDFCEVEGRHADLVLEPAAGRVAAALSERISEVLALSPAGRGVESIQQSGQV